MFANLLRITQKMANVTTNIQHAQHTPIAAGNSSADVADVFHYFRGRK